MIFYHFTCDHGHRGLIEEGHTLPVPQPVLKGVRLSWFTTNPKGDGTALDAPLLLTCDRLEYRFRVTDDTDLRPWLGSHEQAAMPPIIQRVLHNRYGNPAEWYISSHPVPVEVGDPQ